LVLAGLHERFPRLRHLWADQAYTGPILDWIKEQLGWTVEVVERSPRRGFVVTPDGEFQRVKLPAIFEPLPRRWVVEGTQPHYLQYALDVQTARSHDRTHWVAQSA
jgi:putative transposase